MIFFYKDAKTKKKTFCFVGEGGVGVEGRD